jgi:hypothetical protein
LDLENQSRQVLKSALRSVRRRSFFRSYLLLLWPDSERLLLEMARRLGGEVQEPGSATPLLTASLSAGIKKFDHHRKREGYDPTTWVSNVYLHFWQGAIEKAGFSMGIRCHSADGVWNPAHQHFLDWRLQHPGDLSWEYCQVTRPATEAERFYRLLLGREGPRPWVVKEVLRRLGDGC